MTIGTAGFEVVWLHTYEPELDAYEVETCSHVDENITTATPNQTVVRTLGGATGVDTLHSWANIGKWLFCYKPAGGNWTEVHEQLLTVIPPPTYTPSAGIAGMVTPIVFSGEMEDGDFVALVPPEVGCANAFITSSNNNTLPPSALQSSTAFTTINMIQPDTLIVCFATAEVLHVVVALQRCNCGTVFAGFG